MPPWAQRIWSLVRQLQTALAGRTIRSGTATLTFSASTNSTGTVVTHGLGKVPTEVVATSLSAPAFGRIPNCTTTTYTDTTFTLNGEVKTAFSGTADVCWIAVG